MKKNYPQLSSYFKPGFFLVVFLFFGFNGFGQSISNVIISENEICTGKELQVDFRATNGFFSRFTSNTTYIIQVGIYDSNNQTFNTFYEETFQSSQPSTGGWFGYRDFSRTFNIPITLASRNDYQILVSSINPTVRTTGGLSEIISINSSPERPEVNSNSPLCEKEDIQLTASDVPGATYAWTGPNNFTSDEQNPVIPNATSVNAGDYSVTTTVNGCTSEVATTNVVVNPNPTITSTTPGSRCGQGTLSLGATASTGTINWYDTATGGTSLGTGTTFTTPSISSNTTYYVDATSNGCTTGTRTPVLATVDPIPSAPIAKNNGPICVEGLLKLAASGIPGATYQWTGPDGFTSNQQNPEIPNMTAAKAGIYSVTATVNGCTSDTSTTTVNVNVNTPSTGDETTAGTDSWVGHVYDGNNFGTYLGTYTEREEFSQGFGGNESCFEVSSENGFNSLFTETFSVRYKNQSSLYGLYVVDLTSDDGIRFRINGELIHDNWVNRAPDTDDNVLLNLDQEINNLEYEYYENTGQNEVAFQNLRAVSKNELGGATDQNICVGEPIQEITADAIQTYNGISLVGTGYQWYYGTEADGDLQPIQNATGQNFTPDFSAEPFDTPGEYYVFRKVSVSSGNNRLNGNFDAKVYENFSSPAQITILSSPKLIDFNVPAKVCVNQEFNITGNIIGTGPFLVEGTINGTAFSYNNISESFSFPFSVSENISIEINRITDNNGNGCITNLNEIRTIETGPNTWTGTENTNWNNTNNWSCNSLPTLETDVLIPENLVSGNYPEIITGDNALAKNLVIENNASVLVDDNWLRIAGDLTNDGVLTTETGSISFEGSSAQTIPALAFENNRIQNLQIDNPSGVTSQAIIEVTGTLKVEKGNLNTGNELTLISNENQTALIDGSGKGEVIGLVSMQRYLDKAFGYKYFSSPFQNSVVGDFAPFMDFSDPESGFPHFYRYEENRRVDSLDLDATGWEPYTETSNNLNISEGYAPNFGTSSASQTIELIGEVNNGEIPARQLENNHREYTKGFHLVGNPYPSPIDWNADNGWTRDNIDNGIYFFTASDDNQYTGTYTAFVNDISTGDSNVDGSSENIIPSMQGFFIKVSDSDTQDLITGSFGMDNNVRVTNFEQEFYRSQLPEQKSLIRLEAGFKETNRKDAMVIYFSSYATPNFEKEMDAHKLMNTDPAVPSFYNITTDKKELSINAIPFPESRSYKKIPLGIKADQNGPMQINLASIENLSQNFNVYLIDHVKSIGQNLNRDPEYTFNIKAGTHNSRFELMFSEEEVPSPAIAFNEPFDVKVENGNVVIELNLEESQQGILRASTITGQILQIKQGRGKDQVIFDGITSDGVYIINLQVGKERHAKKVVIKK